MMKNVGVTMMKKLFLILSCLLLSSAVLWAIVSRYPYYQSNQLIKAIEKQNYSDVDRLLSSGVDPNTPNCKITRLNSLFEVSPRVSLSVACQNDDIEAVKLLIKYGASAEHIQGTSWSPLREAIIRCGPNSLEIIKTLLDNGADPYYEESGDDAFFATAGLWVYLKTEDRSNEAVQILDYLLARYQETPSSISRKAGKTLISVAVGRSDNDKIVEYLLENGDNPHSLYCGKSLYECAVLHGNEKIIGVLEPYYLTQSSD